MQTINVEPMTMRHNVPNQYGYDGSVVHFRTWNLEKGQYNDWGVARSVAINFAGDHAAAWEALQGIRL